jgi:hypothetical protein
MLHRLISYGLVLGLGVAVLAVILLAAPSGTNDDAATVPGLGPGPSAVLGAEILPNADVAGACAGTEYLEHPSDPSTTPTPAEPTPVPTIKPCVDALAWSSTPMPAAQQEGE